MAMSTIAALTLGGKWKIRDSESINTLSERNNTAWVPHDPAVETISVRARLPGDRFQPKGMTKEKKLQDFMVDAKIPKHLRDKVPILLSQERVAAVVGWRTADWATVKTNDARIVELLFVRDDLK